MTTHIATPPPTPIAAKTKDTKAEILSIDIVLLAGLLGFDSLGV
ncbi:MAG: hypothetical protein ACE1S7_05165 [Candidatus Tisiphia sp.]